ncbi:O-antigen ligase family protein [Candidatus Daviesbacteria bacterium]|nr:O-antigen ligase family protein [Candidatus Daviesbacteria bacterium]
MKELIENYFSLIAKIVISILVISTLFLFTRFSTEFYETAKFIVLGLVVSLMLILVALKYTVNNKVTLIRTPLDLPFLILITVGVVSTLISPSPYISLLGNQLKISSSLVGLIVYVLFYFVLTNNLKSEKDITFLIYLILGGGAILSVISLLVFAGVQLLPTPWPQGVNFTPTGSTVATTAVLAMMIPIVASLVLKSPNMSVVLVATCLLALFGSTIALVGQMSTWVAGTLALLLSILAINPKLDLKGFKMVNLSLVVGAVIIIALVAFLSFIPPFGGTQNPLNERAKSFPRELQLPFIHSWKISVSSFRDSPFWGSGPATYLFDFTLYKPIEYNNTNLWNVRFDSAFNEYLQTLATLGGIGLLGLLSLTALFISTAWAVLSKNNHQPLELGLGIAGITFFILLALIDASLVIWVVGLIILASFMVFRLEGAKASPNYARSGFKKTLLRITSLSSRESSETIRVEALPSILLVIILALLGVASFFGGKLVLADYHHRLALDAVAKNDGITAYNELIRAEQLNPLNDLYRTDIAQINFAIANAIALANAPTEASPAGTLTDQHRQNIQVLLQQSITEARQAVTLSPKSAINWEILALLYRQISGVAENALIFSLDAYGRAIFQDPLNPLLRLNVGGTYYAIKNYDLAIRFFTDSINIKPDFANGFYNLAVALRDKGDLNGALAAAQKALELVDPQSSDYKVATDLVNDLKTKTGVAPEDSSLTAPTATDKEALQKEELPDVVDVGEPPEKIATPEAVKRRPSPSPSPKP